MKPSFAYHLAAALVTLLLPLAAMAQSNGTAPPTPPPENGNVHFDGGGLLAKKKSPDVILPDVRGPAQTWPRLDRGAVLCRSEADLTRLVARRRGDAIDGPVDCQIIRGPTGISIVKREAAGITQVQTNNPSAGGAGWTDAWLPNTPPPR
jgi:hypothetical protein